LAQAEAAKVRAILLKMRCAGILPRSASISGQKITETCKALVVVDADRRSVRQPVPRRIERRQLVRGLHGLSIVPIDMMDDLTAKILARRNPGGMV